MAVALAEKTCTPCRGGIPPLTPEEAESYRSQAPAWALVDGATRIERTQTRCAAIRTPWNGRPLG